MKRHTTARRHVARAAELTPRRLQLGVVGLVTVLAACATPAHYEPPSDLRGYELLITRDDSLGKDLADGLRHHGFTVRPAVRGGSRPTAYVLVFTFRETEPPALTWLHLRLADTRTGAILRAVSAPLDSLGPSAADQARALVDSITVSPP